MDQLDFYTAPMTSVVAPEEYRNRKDFVSVAQYPRGFEPDDDEFGMLVEGDVVQQRLFFLSRNWPWG